MDALCHVMAVVHTFPLLISCQNKPVINDKAHPPSRNAAKRGPVLDKECCIFEFMKISIAEVGGNCSTISMIQPAFVVVGSTTQIDGCDISALTR